MKNLETYRILNPGLASYEVLNAVKNYCANGTRIQSINVYKGKNGYVDIITFDDGNIFVFRSLTFGYGGGGPDDLKELLQFAGVSADKAIVVKEQYQGCGLMSWHRGDDIVKIEKPSYSK